MQQCAHSRVMLCDSQHEHALSHECANAPLDYAFVPEPIRLVAPQRTADGRDWPSEGLSRRSTRKASKLAPLYVHREAVVHRALACRLEPGGHGCVHPRHALDPLCPRADESILCSPAAGRRKLPGSRLAPTSCARPPSAEQRQNPNTRCQDRATDRTEAPSVGVTQTKSAQHTVLRAPAPTPLEGCGIRNCQCQGLTSTVFRLGFCQSQQHFAAER